MEINFDFLEQSGNLELLAQQLVEGFITGIHKSPHHGFSVEFAEHRPYNQGESTKYIDWKIFARTNRLYTKQYEEETNLRCLIALDCSSSMYYPTKSISKLKFSIYTSAAIAHLLQKQRDAVGVCFFSNKIDLLTPIKSTSSHFSNLLHILSKKNRDKQRTQKITNVSNVLHEIAEKTHKRSLIIIFSDLFEGNGNTDEIFNGLQHLKHKKHEVVIFHVSDHATELNFDFKERPYEFIDMEKQQKIRINPAEVREHFTKQLQEFHAMLKLKCNQLKIDFITTHVGKHYFEVLQAYLIKRSKMK